MKTLFLAVLITFAIESSIALIIACTGIMKKIKYTKKAYPFEIKIDENDWNKYHSLGIKHLRIETPTKDSNISARDFIKGRGSWRVTRGAFYSTEKLAKDIEDEFNKKL